MRNIFNSKYMRKYLIQIRILNNRSQTIAIIYIIKEIVCIYSVYHWKSTDIELSQTWNISHESCSNLEFSFFHFTVSADCALKYGIKSKVFFVVVVVVVILREYLKIRHSNFVNGLSFSEICIIVRNLIKR